MPKLSIITINYNNLEGLKKTIKSVVNQNFKDFEYIIIDGGSTDGSSDYILSQSKNLAYWISEADSGVYNAMNKGIAKATGEYLLFLNSGDHLYSNTVLEENKNHLLNYDLIYFNIQLADDQFSKIVSYPEKLSFSYFYEETLCHQSTLIKKELFDVIGWYDENLKLVSDWKFFILALYRFNCSYLKINEVLTTYYLDGMSSNLTNREILKKERKEVLNACFKGYIDDQDQLLDLKRIVSNLRKSRKIGLLIKFGLLKKF